MIKVVILKLILMMIIVMMIMIAMMITMVMIAIMIMILPMIRIIRIATNTITQQQNDTNNSISVMVKLINSN